LSGGALVQSFDRQDQNQGGDVVKNSIVSFVSLIALSFPFSAFGLTPAACQEKVKALGSGLYGSVTEQESTIICARDRSLAHTTCIQNLGQAKSVFYGGLTVIEASDSCVAQRNKSDCLIKTAQLWHSYQSDLSIGEALNQCL
jgi:hypothetical protein